MIKKEIVWYAVKEAKPDNGTIVLVYKPAKGKQMSDLFDFAIYYSDWDGKEVFIDFILHNGVETPINYQPDFWASIPFPFES